MLCFLFETDAHARLYLVRYLRFDILEPVGIIVSVAIYRIVVAAVVARFLAVDRSGNGLGVDPVIGNAQVGAFGADSGDCVSKLPDGGCAVGGFLLLTAKDR